VKTLLPNLFQSHGKTIQSTHSDYFGNVIVSFTDDTYMILEIEHGYEDETRITTLSEVKEYNQWAVESGVMTAGELDAWIAERNKNYDEQRRRHELQLLAQLAHKYPGHLGNV